MKKNALKKGALGLSLLAMSSLAAAGPVDLSSWVEETGGNWVLQSGNNAVKQLTNGQPTVFHNDEDSQGKKLSGTIEVQTTSDNDYIGFVLGYNSGDLQKTSTDFILIDWKQGDQNYYGAGKKGLSISKVTGKLDDGSGAWSHDSTDGVEELQRATTLGDTGWADNTSYSFDLIFTASLIEVMVNGSKELSITGSFSNGSFGFYNYSQGNVLYAGIEEDIAPPVSAVPVPAAAWLIAPSLVGFMALRRKNKKS